MKIAIIYSAYPPLSALRRGDGGADFCKRLVEQLAREGCEIDVITSQWSQPPSPEEKGTQHPKGVHVHRVVVDWGFRGLWKGEHRALREHLKTLDPALILVVFPGGGLGCRYLLPTLIRFLCPGKPVITMLFAFVVRRGLFYLPLFLCAEALLLLTSKKICFESVTQMSRFKKVAPFLSSRCVFIPTGSTVAVNRRYDCAAAGLLRERIGLKLDRRYIAFLGGLRANKNVEFFLRATKQILAANPDLCILFVGARKREEIASRFERRVLRLIDKLGMREAVSFTGYLEESAFLDHLLSCDLCVLPFDDRLGRSTLALAMSLGMPIVSVSNGRHTFLKDGESALLVPALDPKLLARAMEKLLRFPAMRTRVSVGALAASAELSWERLSLRWKELLQAASDSQRSLFERSSCA